MKKCRKGHDINLENTWKTFSTERGERIHCKICYFQQMKNRNSKRFKLAVHYTYEEAFWNKVNKTDNCWIWTASKKYLEYGYYRGKFAHIVAYELIKGPVPDGLELDHKCNNPTCVNPAHLEPVTHAVNTKRGKRFWKAFYKRMKVCL